jgi:hypothetical protein
LLLPQNGIISAEELARVLKEPVEQVRKYIAEYDLDKDGSINYEVSARLQVSGCSVGPLSALPQEFMRMVLPKDLKYKISRY